MTVRTIVFDAGLTLLGAHPSFPEVVITGAAKAGVTITMEMLQAERESVGNVFVDHDEEWRAAGRTSPHIGDPDTEDAYWHELYARMIGRMAPEADAEEVARHVHAEFLAPGTWRPFDEVDEVLRALGARGVRLGLISNWAGWLRDTLDLCELTHHFECIVVSGEEGVEKPDHAIFRRAFELLDEVPDEGFVYVGDDVRADVEPSLELGITPVLIDRFERNPDFVGTRITDLHGLAQVLDLPDRGGAA